MTTIPSPCVPDTVNPWIVMLLWPDMEKPWAVPPVAPVTTGEAPGAATKLIGALAEPELDTVTLSGYVPEPTCTVWPATTREAAGLIEQKGWMAVPEPPSEQLGFCLATYSVGAGADGGGGLVPIVYESITLPCTQAMSSFPVGGPHTASIRMPVDEASTRRWARCIARKAVRASVPDHGVSRLAPPPPAVMWVTPWIGLKRS